MPATRAAINFILVTVLLDVIGFGIIIPVLPNLLVELEGISLSEASAYGGVLITAFAISQFICSPIMGGLSDRYGRKPVILLSLFGFTLDYLLLAFAPSYVWFLVGRIVAGVFGASFTAATAYIADISTEENRATYFGYLGAAFGAGFVIGPMLGGLLGEIGLRVPFYAAAGLTFLNFLYGLFVLPESLPAENRRAFDWRRANPIGTLRQLVSYKSIRLLLITLLLFNIGIHAVNTNWSYFVIYRFGWTEFTVGVSLAVAGVMVGAAQAVLSQRVKDWIGTARGILLGLALYALGMLLFAFASQTWMMFVFIIPYCLGGVAAPLLQSYLTSQVAPDQQGELQGGLTALQSVTTIIGPVVMTSLFAYTTAEGTPFYFPGSAFLLAAMLMVLAWLVARAGLLRAGRKI